MDRNFGGPARYGNRTIHSSPLTSSNESEPFYLPFSGL